MTETEHVAQAVTSLGDRIAMAVARRPWRGVGIRGLAGASFPAGSGFSLGMDRLTAKLNATGKVEATTHQHGVFSYENTQNLTGLLTEAHRVGQKLLIYGHSLGADETTRIASALNSRGIVVDVIAAFDPTLWPLPLGPFKLTRNITTAFSFYQKNGGLGQGVLENAPGNTRTFIVKQKVNCSHVEVDDVQSLHDMVLGAVN